MSVAGRDRGVSTTLSYVLTLGITSILISGLLIGVTGIVDDRQSQTARNALDVVGERVAANMMAADRLAQTGPATTVVTVRLPDQISNRGYSVEVNGSSQLIVVTLDGEETSATVRFANDTNVADTEVLGGDLRVVLTPANELEVRPA